MLEELIEYKEKYGDCLVLRRYKSNLNLGTWVSTQRHQYQVKKKGKSNYLTDERIHKLEEFDFVWKVKKG